MTADLSSDTRYGRETLRKIRRLLRSEFGVHGN
jgi:hypothetical protein